MAEWLRMHAREVLENQKLRFLLVGLVNTLFGFGLFALLIFGFGDSSYLMAAIVSHIAATTVSFLLNRTVVFRRSGPVIPDFVRFQVTYVVVLGINLVLLTVLVEIAGWPILLSQAACVLVVGVTSYLGHKYFSFHRRDDSSTKG